MKQSAVGKNYTLHSLFNPKGIYLTIRILTDKYNDKIIYADFPLSAVTLKLS